MVHTQVSNTRDARSAGNVAEEKLQEFINNLLGQ